MMRASGHAEPASGPAVAVVHAALREAILSGQLPQGTVLSQVQLAERFGVSRTPLREALRLLQGEGLIDAERNRRVRVASVSIEDLEELYAMRIVLESLAVRLSVARLTEDDFANLHRLLDEMDEHARAHDIDAWNRPHRRFHRGLVTHAGNRITSLVSQLAETSDRYRRIAVTQGDHAWTRVANEHRGMLEACELRDGAAAASAMARHLARTVLSVVALMAPEHDPARVRVALAGVVDGYGAADGNETALELAAAALAGPNRGA